MHSMLCWQIRALIQSLKFKLCSLFVSHKPKRQSSERQSCLQIRQITYMPAVTAFIGDLRLHKYRTMWLLQQSPPYSSVPCSIRDVRGCIQCTDVHKHLEDCSKLITAHSLCSTQIAKGSGLVSVTSHMLLTQAQVTMETIIKIVLDVAQQPIAPNNF